MAVGAHAIRFKRLKDGGTDFVPYRNIGKGHRVGRGKKSIEVVVQGKDSVGIDAKPFPHRVATLDRGIKYTHFCLVARQEAVADPDLQVGILGIKRLKHLKRI